jgi:DNA (cytosine-5)-methyltransferase 1
MKLRTLDLFSGIGGFSLGLESTGFFETIGFVEKDKFCQKVLKKHWSNINIEEDIRNVKGEKYQADVVTGGFPCQPFSVAGKRKSTADDRYLWDEMLRVIRETKPRWVIGENVEGIVNINEGMVLRQVLNDLENEGFKSQCIIIPASGIGAWHQRKRIWIIANSSSQRSSSQSIGEHRELDKEIKRKKETRYQSTLCTSSSCSDVPNTNNNGSYRSQGNATKQSSNEQKDRLSFRDDKDVPNTNSGFSFRENEEIQSRGNAFTNGSEDVSNSNKRDVQTGCQRQWGICEEHKRKGTSNNATSIYETLPNTSSERSQGCGIQHNLEGEQRSKEFTTKTGFERQQTWWEIESELCGIPNGVSYELDKDRSNRIKSLGNSIVPQIARQIGLSIMEAELNG